MSTQYKPVDPDYHELISEVISRNKPIVIHYFGKGNTLESKKGAAKEILSNQNHEEFVAFKNGEKIRLDRIITFDGKPGPAYDEYDSFALACLDCTGGMD